MTNIEFDINYAMAGFQAEYAALATIMQADLAKIGIKTNLKPRGQRRVHRQRGGHDAARTTACA